jgi:hypothetical protein
MKICHFGNIMYNISLCVCDALIRGLIQMKFSITGQEKVDLLTQVAA